MGSLCFWSCRYHPIVSSCCRGAILSRGSLIRTCLTSVLRLLRYPDVAGVLYITLSNAIRHWRGSAALANASNAATLQRYVLNQIISIDILVSTSGSISRGIVFFLFPSFFYVHFLHTGHQEAGILRRRQRGKKLLDNFLPSLAINQSQKNRLGAWNPSPLPEAIET